LFEERIYLPLRKKGKGRTFGTSGKRHKRRRREKRGEVKSIHFPERRKTQFPWGLKGGPLQGGNKGGGKKVPRVRQKK